MTVKQDDGSEIKMFIVDTEVKFNLKAACFQLDFLNP